MKALMIARRDLAHYLTSFYGYLIIAIMLVISGLLFNVFALGDSAQYSAEVMKNYFYFTFGCTMIAAWLLSMRSVAEERQTRTVAVLDGSPIPAWQVIAGKYLAVMGMVSLFILLTSYMPMLVFIQGKVAIAQILVGYAGLFLIGSAAASIGIFGSALAKDQEAAVFFSGALLVVMLIMWMLSTISEPPFSYVFEYLALYQKHFQPFEKGRLLLSNVVYYGSVSWLFLIFATRAFEWRRSQ